MQRSAVDKQEDAMLRSWERRLEKERRAISAHLAEAAGRALEMGDVGSFDWDWWLKYGDELTKELQVAYLAVLLEQGFIDTPILSAQQVAANYAKKRGAELLRLEGRENIVQATRQAVRDLVAETIEKGDSLNTLQKKLREDFAFSKSRAEAIARTETAKALGEGSLKSYMTLGHEGKEWLTAGDERVDGGDPSGPCIQAAGEGAIALGRMFNNGFSAPPAHPRCRCTLMPVRHLPR